MEALTFDYVVVGSGAGGGTVAARLAEEGMRVLLLEAGGDPREMTGGVRGMGPANRLPDDYDVPAFHAFASENEALRWDFHVRHYADDARQARDPKSRAEGTLYPRAGTLGGCTAHNAMILICPHNEDWAAIQRMTGDDGWSPRAMHRHFQQLEACRHRPVQQFLARGGHRPHGHGYDGWLSTEKAIPRAALFDGDLKDVLLTSIRDDGVGRGGFRPEISLVSGKRGGPQRHRPPRRGRRRALLHPAQHAGRPPRRQPGARARRRGPLSRPAGGGAACAGDARAHRRDRARDGRGIPQGRAPLPRPCRAVGAPGELRRAEARREVILAGGAFNTPQLLMLSGIGDPRRAGPARHRRRVPLPGVGRNLQDRYEVAVVNRMAFDSWESMRGADYSTARPPLGRMEPRGQRPLRHQRRGRRRHPPLVGRRTRARPLLHGASGEVQRLLSRLCRRPRPEPAAPQLVRAQGAYRQPGGPGAACLGRPARHAAHRLPLFRRGQPGPRTRSFRRGRRASGSSAALPPRCARAA